MASWKFTGLPAYRDPKPEESAAGLLLHLIERNHYRSSDAVADVLGIRPSDLVVATPEDLAVLGAAIECDPERLGKDSVRVANVTFRGGRLSQQLTLRGIEISNRLHAAAARRVCAACIEEDRRHRFWWELTPIGTCPRHSCELVGRCSCGRELTWRDAGVYCCSGCGKSDPSALSRRPASTEHTQKDMYLLSRFGAAQADPLPILDQLPVYEAVAMMERVGAAAEGFRQDWQNATKLGIEERNLQQIGFAILREGRLDEVLDRLWNEYKAQVDRKHDGFTTAYGWFYHWFNCKGGREYSPLLADAFLTHGAERFSINSNVRLGKLSSDKRRMLSLKEAAHRCESSVFAMRSIFELLGFLRHGKRPGAQHSFPIDVVERIAKDLQRSCTLQEAQKRLGIGHKSIHGLIEQHILTPKLKGGTSRHVYVFSIDDVDALLERLGSGAKIVHSPSPGLVSLDRRGVVAGGTTELIRCVLDGRLRIRERNPALDGLRGLFAAREDISAVAAETAHGSEVPAALAARLLRLNQPGLRKAQKQGLITGAIRGDRLFIPRAEVKRFAAKYISLTEICERTQQPSKRVLAFLATHRVSPNPRIANCRLVGFARTKVTPLLDKLKSGELSIGPRESDKARLVRAVVRLLEKAETPIPSGDLVSQLRRDNVRLGPSDSLQFLYGSMWESRDTIVNIPSAGWWLKARPFVAAAYAGDGSPRDQFDRAADAIVNLLSEADDPIPPQGLLARLDASGIKIARSDKEVFLRQLVARNRDRIAKLTGLGYWLRERPYAPAKYEPTSYPSGVQTRWQRIGAFAAEYLEIKGKPSEHSELGSMLLSKGILAKARNARGDINDALNRLPDQFVYLRGHGYWLRQLPYEPAGYRTAPRPYAG